MSPRINLMVASSILALVGSMSGPMTEAIHCSRFFIFPEVLVDLTILEAWEEAYTRLQACLGYHVS